MGSAGGASARFAAAGAAAGHLDGDAADVEVEVAGASLQVGVEGAALQFVGGAAALADQEIAAMRMLRLGAADKGVAALDAMDQPLFDQEVERAIDGRRRHPATLTIGFAGAGQLVDEFVGADRSMALPDQGQNLTAQLGQPGAALAAHDVGRRQRIGHAMGVVVLMSGKAFSVGHGLLRRMITPYIRLRSTRANPVGVRSHGRTGFSAECRAITVCAPSPEEFA